MSKYATDCISACVWKRGARLQWEYLRRNCEWRSVQTMSNADLIVSGSTNQADRRFSDVSRGRLCDFLSVSTLLRANCCRVSQWTADTVDEILIEWDAMYVPIQKHCRLRIYLIEYIGLRWLRIEPNQIHCPLLQLGVYVYNQVLEKLLSTYKLKPDLKLASEDQIIEALLSLDYMKKLEDSIWYYKGTWTREKREDSIFWHWKHEFHQCLTWICETESYFELMKRMKISDKLIENSEKKVVWSRYCCSMNCR